MTRRGLTIVVGACTLLMAVEGFGGELTVSPGGLSGKTALERIRAARAKGDKAKWTVRVKGMNALSEPLAFTAEDHDIEFVGEAEAAFSGGTRVTNWKKNPGGWWEAKMPRGKDGRPVFIENLWVNGHRAVRARVPNEGYWHVTNCQCLANSNATIAAKFVETACLTNEESKALAALTSEDLKYTQMGLISKWTHARRILRGYNAKNGRLETWSPQGWTPWQKWNARETLVWFENVRSGFDAPGEWFEDMAAGLLCYRPLSDEDMAKAEVYAPFAKVSRLVDMRGAYAKGRFVKNITFRNIRFLHAETVPTTEKNGPAETWQFQAAVNADAALTFEGVKGVKIVGCTVSHTGNYALRFNSGCVSNEIVNCVLTELGAGGILMGSRLDCAGKDGAISRRILKPCRPDAVAFNIVSNCTITCAGRYNPEGTGVALMHCSDTKVVHNDIRDIYYTGVSVGFTWGFCGSVAQRNEIAWNRISDLGKGIMSDMGGVYTLCTSFGTRVHHNEIHDVWSFSYGGWALYADEGSEGIVMENNICWNTTDGGFHQHYGTGCLIRNNVFAFNRELGAVRMARAVVQDIPCTLHFVNNIVMVREGPLVGRGVRNVGGVWANNVWWDLRGKDAAQFDGTDWSGWVASGKERGSVFADPKFIAPDRYDFALKADSPAFALGFKPIDLKGAGPVK